MQKWLSGRRRTIGNRVGVDSVSRVQIPPSAPRWSKRCICLLRLFLVRAPSCRGSSVPNRNRLRGAVIRVRRCAAVLSRYGGDIHFNRPFHVVADVLSSAAAFFALCTKMPAIKTGPEQRSGPVSRFITVSFRASPTLRHRPAPTLSPDQSAVRRRSRCIR